MPLRFGWRPNDSPVSSSANRVDIGLELYGDDARVSTATSGSAGRVKLYEVGGTGQTAGSSESADRRLMATFHGKFHRNESAAAEARLTFEIEIGPGTVADYLGEVQGFDPECILGVDAFVFTFVNREFRVNLPFFLDSRSEGDFMEVLAVAELDGEQGPTELGSARLNLRIRRSHEVETTTADPGGGSMNYTGDVIGNLILHHEQYLVQGAYHNRGSAWPAQVSAQLIANPWSGSTRIPFQAYAAASMKIVLMDDLLGDLVPSASYLQGSVQGVSDGAAAEGQARSRIQSQISSKLTDIFTDAGLTSPNVWWQGQATSGGAQAAVSAFTSAFRSSFGGGYSLRNSAGPLVAPFWTYYVSGDSSLQSVGVAERLEYDQVTEQAQTGSREYLLAFTAPIGSGDKKIQAPIRVRTGYFLPRVTRAVSDEGYDVDRRFGSLAELNVALDAMAAKVAIVIAHEIGHSLGLMHDMKIQNSGPYSESAGTPVLSMMSSGIESDAYGKDTKFSHQAKVIWHRAFGVTPDWTNTYLQNKTWGSDWSTVDWGERKSRLYRLHQESGMTQVGLSTTDPPPHTGTGGNVQRGTYVPP